MEHREGKREINGRRERKIEENIKKRKRGRVKGEKKKEENQVWKIQEEVKGKVAIR